MHSVRIRRQPEFLCKYLESAGFIDAGKKSPEFALFVKAVKAFKTRFPLWNMLCWYVIPSCDPFERDLWGYPLGSRLYDEVTKNNEKHGNELATLGFRDMWSNFQGLFYCFEIYKRMNGHLFIPVDFVIPMNSFDYPVVMWNLPLGQVLQNIKYNGTASQTQLLKLEGLGINCRYARFPEALIQRVYAGVQCYSRKYNSNLIPVSYVISVGDTSFPKEYWGMKLGEQWKSIVESVN